MHSNGATMRMSSDQEALERIVLQAFGLRPVIRRAFLLCDIQGFMVAEAAAILGISPAAVTARLNRARQEMNVKLAVRQDARAKSAALAVSLQ